MNYCTQQIIAIILTFGVSFFYLSCTKNKTEPSVWFINGKKYTSRNTEVIRSNNAALPSVSLLYMSKSTGSDNQSWGISFSGSALPQSGTYSIRNYNDTDRSGLITVNYKTYVYVRSSFDSGTIVASSYKGVARYDIAPVWLVREDGGTDSFLFSGVFYEPISDK